MAEAKELGEQALRSVELPGGQTLPQAMNELPTRRDIFAWDAYLTAILPFLPAIFDGAVGLQKDARSSGLCPAQRLRRADIPKDPMLKDRMRIRFVDMRGRSVQLVWVSNRGQRRARCVSAWGKVIIPACRGAVMQTRWSLV